MKKNDRFQLEIPLSLCKRVNDLHWIDTQLIKGKLPQEILHFSYEIMDQFYIHACEFLKEKEIGRSLSAFIFLTFLNPTHYTYWLGLGSSLQLNGEYEEAIEAFELAALCESNHPIPYFYLAKCFFSIHDRVHALQALELALEYSDNNDAFEEIHRQAILAKALILKEQ